MLLAEIIGVLPPNINIRIENEKGYDVRIGDAMIKTVREIKIPEKNKITVVVKM